MLAIVSDLHFQQTDPDSIRYIDEDGVVYQTGVHRNVRVPALDHFFRRVAENAVECKAKTVHIVFAGDILELHRSPIWFMDKNPQVRPFDPVRTNLTDGAAIEEKGALELRLLNLLNHLEVEHEQVWNRLREWIEDPRLHLDRPSKPGENERPFDYVVHYIPGNHDRLANATPEIRRHIRRLLSMPESDGHFPVRLDFIDHQARIRHGHEYDALNFGNKVGKAKSLDLDAEAYLKPAFGDYVTVEVATRLALAFRVYFGEHMRSHTPRGARLREVYQDLLEFDDVRPMTALLDYLSEKADTYMRREQFDDVEVLRALKLLVVDILEQAARSDYFKGQKPVRRWKWLLTPAKEVLKLSPDRFVEFLVEIASAMTGGRKKAGPSAIARYEPELDSSVLLVFGGHTHRPEVVPVAPSGTTKIGETFYINTGTWRTTIPQGVGTFGRYRALTYALCYALSEQRVLPDRKRFDLWTGAMAQVNFKQESGADNRRSLAMPYDAKADKLGKQTYTLRIERLEVNKLPTDGGAAELRLKLGVDEQDDRDIKWNGAKPGGGRALTPDEGTFIVHDSLDGEIRLYGHEDDLVFDDPMPWALYRLPRAGKPQAGKVNRFQPGDPFKLGSSAFQMHGYGHTQIVVHYTLTKNEPEE